MNTAQLAADYEAARSQATALLSGELTAEKQSEAKNLLEKASSIRAQLELSKEMDAANAYSVSASTAFPSGNGQAASTDPAQAMAATAGTALPGVRAVTPFVIPAMAARDRPRFICDDDGKPDARRAFAIGKWLQATLGRNVQAQKWCLDHGVPLWNLGPNDEVIPIRNFAQSEGVNTAGGFLVFDEFERTIIDLKEKYGVFRTYADRTPMSSDVKVVPRRTGGVTSYFLGEGATITDSSLAWDNIKLVAKKLAALVLVSNELNEDAIISMADKIANEIAWAFALTEDNCGFNGDGTNSSVTFDGATVTYGGIVGVRSKILGLDGTIGNVAGIVVGTGSASYAALTMSDFHKVKGRLPEYAAMQPDVAWYCSRAFYYEVMERLIIGLGGVTAREGEAGGTEVFLGYPVRMSQVMPKVAAASQVACLFGSLRLSAAFGDRRQTSLMTSEHSNFATDQLAVRGVQRFDINVHDVGNASATAASRIAGPIVALATGA